MIRRAAIFSGEIIYCENTHFLRDEPKKSHLQLSSQMAFQRTDLTLNMKKLYIIHQVSLIPKNQSIVKTV
jgi:hypothetical protein